MRRKNTFRLIVASLFLATTSFSQTILMGDPGPTQSSPANCNTFGVGGLNFQDNGGSSNYSPNLDITTTFCPDLSTGTKMSLMFGINMGAEFNVHASDTLYIYDGPTTSSPLLGAFNSATNPNGISFQATWNNPSGCLTVRFKSDATNEGTGWIATAQCGNPNQPFEMHMEAFVNGQGNNALNPLDSGYVDICFGDSILFVAKPIFPYSLEATGSGYSQNVNNVTYGWGISDGGTYPNNDSIWFKPATRNGFLVELSIRDSYPQTFWLNSKVRVSQLPNFSTTGPLQSTICLGESTNLLGGVTPSDTVGVSIPAGTFQLGGSHAGTTYLPDGSGINYSTGIQISGFPAGSTIQNITDLNEVCLTIEHSFLGDLEIWLECPPVAPATTGAIVALIDAYSGGAIPGGVAASGTFLGRPYDDWGGGNAGIGWEYCFSSAFNTYGLMSTGGYGNTVNVAAQAGPPQLSAGVSMNPNVVYQPVNPFTNFVGCPVNGDWKIHVRDNQSIDDGTIFEWSLYFDASYFPGMSSYQNTADQSWWTNDPTIISGQNDTSIVVLPTTVGAHNYTFNVIDNFGCAYDTTVTINVRPLPAIFQDTMICNNQYQVSGTQTFSGGVWSASSPNVTFSSTTANNPLITATTPGVYTINFLDNSCQDPLTATITLPAAPTIFADDTICGTTYQVDSATVTSTNGGVWSVLNPTSASFSDNTIENPLITINSIPYQLQVTYRDALCPNLFDQATLLFVPAGTPTVPTMACNLGTFGLTVDSYEGGTWSIVDNPATTWHEDTAAVFVYGNNVDEPGLSVSTGGIYTVQYYDAFCDLTTTSDIYFPPYLYTEVVDTQLCTGIQFPLDAWQPPYSDVTYAWNTGATTPSIIVTQSGEYIVTVSNACHSYTDTAKIDYYVCDIEAPNIISLSSQSGNNLWFVQSDGIADFNCIIVNRWGNIIYEFNDVNGTWDGKDRAGNLVSEGVYFYTIKAKIIGGEELTKHGFIQVVH